MSSNNEIYKNKGPTMSSGNSIREDKKNKYLRLGIDNRLLYEGLVRSRSRYQREGGFQ